METYPLTTPQPRPISLGPLRLDLIDTYLRWDNDPQVMRGYGRAHTITRDERLAGLHAQLAGDNAHFTVYDTASVPLGVVTLSVDHDTRTAEFFIALGAEGRGRGLATPATTATIEYAFGELGLRNVILTVLAPNTTAIRAYQNAGFQRIGIRRDSGYWDGHPCDELLMDITPADLDPDITR
jgi:diamine N-acetyltransferase